MKNKIVFVLLFVIVLSYTVNSGIVFADSYNILVIQDVPYYINSNSEYRLFYDILRKKGNVVIKGSWEIYNVYTENVNIGEWVKAGGYSLVVVLWSRGRYSDAVRALLDGCFEEGVPVLFLPGYKWDLLGDYGLRMVDSSYWGVNFSVADVEVARGVWVVGVRERGVVSVFRPVNALEFPTRFVPVVVDNESNALVVVGKIGESRVAAVAPYFYGDGSYDNVLLFGNIVDWLLMGEVKEREESGEWSSVVFKNLTQARVEILGEIERLRGERDKLLEEIDLLREKYGGLENVTRRIGELENMTRELKNKLEECERVRAELNRSSVALSEVRRVYRFLGLVGGLSFVGGFGVAMVIVSYVRKRRGE